MKEQSALEIISFILVIGIWIFIIAVTKGDNTDLLDDLDDLFDDD